MRRAADLECIAAEATLASSAARIACDAAQKQHASSLEAIESLNVRLHSTSDALKAQQQRTDESLHPSTSVPRTDAHHPDARAVEVCVWHNVELFFLVNFRLQSLVMHKGGVQVEYTALEELRQQLMDAEELAAEQKVQAERAAEKSAAAVAAKVTHLERAAAGKSLVAVLMETITELEKLHTLQAAVRS